MREEIYKELKIREEDVKKLKKILKQKEKKEKLEEIEKPNFFVSLANSIFGNFSISLARKNFLKNYNLDLKKANISLLLSSYLSLIFFVTLIFFIVSLLFAIFISIGSPIFIIIRNIFFSFLFTFLVFLILFFYPKIEIKNIERKIEAELPFAALYMATIAGSGVPPVKIFNLISESNEFKEISKQIRKITNKINFLGMDLVTAIRESIKLIPNKNLVEMLNGVATNIITGGDLNEYFNEESKKFLTNYKVSREKFSISAGVYSDIYTGLLITAPMIFMLLLFFIGLIPNATIGGLSVTQLSILGLIVIIILNIIFIIYLQIVTPPS
ncbi:MAG: type II secretion system F family protein [Candidatus Pacearchaeota archaeon]